MRSAQPEAPDGDPGRIESVSAFTRRVKELPDRACEPGWVRGEGSNLLLTEQRPLLLLAKGCGRAAGLRAFPRRRGGGRRWRSATACRS